MYDTTVIFYNLSHMFCYNLGLLFMNLITLKKSDFCVCIKSMIFLNTVINIS